MITYYLEMRSEDELKAKPSLEGINIVEAEIKNFRFNKFLYEAVGEKWGWTDKLNLPDSDWRAYAEDSSLRTWVAYVQGSVAGYYELHSQESGNIELAYFDLTPDFIGKRFGGYLLSHAIKSAWSYSSTERVWVHTCTLDHANALNNYTSRGFSVYDEIHS